MNKKTLLITILLICSGLQASQPTQYRESTVKALRCPRSIANINLDEVLTRGFEHLDTLASPRNKISPSSSPHSPLPVSVALSDEIIQGSEKELEKIDGIAWAYKVLKS